MPDHFTLEPIKPDDPAPFLIQDPEEVQHLLMRLARHPELVCLYPAERREPFALSALLQVAQDHLVFDASPDERTLALLLAAPYMVCVSSLDRVHIQFDAPVPRATTHQGHRAVRTDRPSALLHLQRRDYFRLSVPVRQQVYCRIPQHDDPAFIEAEVADISLGGVSLLGPLPSLLLLPGMRLAGCRIELPEVGVIQVDLLVCATRAVTARNDPRSLRIGCRFIHLAGGSQTLVQRYINRIERSRIARE